MALLVLLRHAKAITRAEWQGEDEDRPLSALGQIQAHRMAAQFVDSASAYSLVYSLEILLLVSTVLIMSPLVKVKP